MFGQPDRNRGQALTQPLEVGISDRHRGLGTVLGLLGKTGKGSSAAGTELVPQLLGGDNDFAQAAQRQFLRRRRLHEFTPGNQALQLKTRPQD